MATDLGPSEIGENEDPLMRQSGCRKQRPLLSGGPRLGERSLPARFERRPSFLLSVNIRPSGTANVTAARPEAMMIPCPCSRIALSPRASANEERSARLLPGTLWVCLARASPRARALSPQHHRIAGLSKLERNETQDLDARFCVDMQRRSVNAADSLARAIGGH